MKEAYPRKLRQYIKKKGLDLEAKHSFLEKDSINKIVGSKPTNKFKKISHPTFIITLNS